MKIRAFFFTFFLFLSSFSVAAENCSDLFVLSSEKPPDNLDVPTVLATSLTENNFPPELKVKSDLLKFAHGKDHGYLLQYMSGAYRLKKIIGPSLPSFLKKSAELEEASLLPLIVVPVYWVQDTQNISYRRAYTAITSFLQLSLQQDPEIVARNLITEQDVQLLAHLLQSLVPSSPPKIFVLEDYPLEDKITKRLAILLENVFYVDVWKQLIDAGIDRTFLSMPGFQISTTGVRTDSERVSAVANKIDHKRKLNNEDKALIKFLAYRFFMGHFLAPERGRNYKELLKPFEVDRVLEIIEPIRHSFLSYKMSFFEKVKAADMFDFIYFGTRLPRSVTEINLTFVQGMQKLIQPLKNEHSQFLADAKRADVGKRANPLPNIFTKPVDPSLFKQTPTPEAVKTYVKTHGKARAPKTEILVQPPLIDTAITVRDVIDRPHIFSLTAGTEYSVVFLRQEKAFKGANVFVFDARAVQELDALPPRIRSEILVAIQAGPTHIEYGQAGIKKLSHVKSKLEGHIYEVKISSSYRAALLRVGSQWRVLAVVPKDDFSQYLRNQSWTR